MATIVREETVNAPGETIWSKLIDDPSHWVEWLTPVRGLEERVRGPVRSGTTFGVRLGKLSGKIRVLEAAVGERLRWKAGPAMMLAMGMGMKGTLEFQRAGNGRTRVRLTMRTPMMMGPMMRMMSGLDPKEEMTKTIARIKNLSEQSPSET